MTEADLINILDNLDKDEFERFKWHLKSEKVADILPIAVCHLSEAKRQNTADLMVQKYEFTGAVEVMKSVLKKINRNDLVKKLPNIDPRTEDPVPPKPPTGKTKCYGSSTLNLPPNEKLFNVRSSFIDGIAGPVLQSLLDKLLEKKVINDAERESVDEIPHRRDKARFVIDTVRNKGEAASSEMIEFLCELDPFLCEHLGLK